MANNYQLKYVPLGKNDSWDPSSFAKSIDKLNILKKLDSKSAKGLEDLANSYIGPEILNLGSEEEIERAVEGYKRLVNRSLEDYLIKNLGDVVKYVGPDKFGNHALAMPVMKRAPKEGEKLSEEDIKYNSTIDKVISLKSLNESLRTKEGLKKVLEEELKGIDDFSKSYWLSVFGAEGISEHVQKKASLKAIKAIGEYGVAKYLKDGLALSRESEEKYAVERKEIASKLQKEVEEASQKSLIPLTQLEIAKIRSKYEESFKKLSEKYQGLVGARQLILEGLGDEVPGIVALAYSKYKTEEEAKRKAEEEQKRKNENS